MRPVPRSAETGSTRSRISFPFESDIVGFGVYTSARLQVSGTRPEPSFQTQEAVIVPPVRNLWAAFEAASPGAITFITKLATKRLLRPLTASIEPDADGYIAKLQEVNLYGFGDSRSEALDALRRDVESLYDDLMADNEFTNEWLSVKAFLKDIIVDG